MSSETTDTEVKDMLDDLKRAWMDKWNVLVNFTIFFDDKNSLEKLAEKLKEAKYIVDVFEDKRSITVEARRRDSKVRVVGYSDGRGYAAFFGETSELLNLLHLLNAKIKLSGAALNIYDSLGIEWYAREVKTHPSAMLVAVLIAELATTSR